MKITRVHFSMNIAIERTNPQMTWRVGALIREIRRDGAWLSFAMVDGTEIDVVAPAGTMVFGEMEAVVELAEAKRRLAEFTEQGETIPNKVYEPTPKEPNGPAPATDCPPPARPIPKSKRV